MGKLTEKDIKATEDACNGVGYWTDSDMLLMLTELRRVRLLVENALTQLPNSFADAARKTLEDV